MIDYAIDAKDVINSLILRLDRKNPGTPSDTYCNAMDDAVNQAKITKTIVDLNLVLDNSIEIIEILENLSKNMKESLNCTFIADDFDRIHFSLCDGFSYDLITTVIILAIISSESFLFIINLICLNRKTGYRKNKEVAPALQKE